MAELSMLKIVKDFTVGKLIFNFLERKLQLMKLILENIDH